MLAVALVMLVASVVVRVSGSSPADAEQTGTVTLSQQTEEVGVRQIQSFCSSLKSNPEADIAIDMRVSADDLCQAFEDSYPASAAEGRRDRYVDLLRSNGLWRQFTGESAAVRFGRGVCRSVGEQQVVATLASVAAVSALCPEHLAQLNLNNAATSTAAGQPTRSTVALWRMNEGRGTSVAFDSSAAGLDATVGSLVRTGERRGSAVSYVFPEAKPNATPVSRERLMVVPDDVGLDPGRRHYSITIRYRTTHHYGNLLQKGQSGTPGGFWKLQQPGGLLQCFWSGSEGQATVNSGRVLNDGRWHVVTCERSGPTLTMTVDGLVSDTTQKRIGSVSNAMPLTVGGKWACNQVRVGCDYFSGSLDYVRIDARP